MRSPRRSCSAACHASFQAVRAPNRPARSPRSSSRRPATPLQPLQRRPPSGGCRTTTSLRECTLCALGLLNLCQRPNCTAHCIGPRVHCPSRAHGGQLTATTLPPSLHPPRVRADGTGPPAPGCPRHWAGPRPTLDWTPRMRCSSGVVTARCRRGPHRCCPTGALAVLPHWGTGSAQCAGTHRRQLAVAAAAGQAGLGQHSLKAPACCLAEPLAGPTWRRRASSSCCPRSCTWRTWWCRPTHAS